MDEKLEKALGFSNLATILNNQKRILKEQYDEELIFYHAGGKFKADRTLFSFVCNLDSKDAVIIDENNVPVKIEVEEFKNLVKSHYTTASDNFLSRYKAISNKRSVEGIVDV